MPETDRFEEILREISRRHPDSLLLNIEQTARVLGLQPRTIYNQTAPKAKRPFPIPVVRLRGPKFRVIDLARFLAGESG